MPTLRRESWAGGLGGCPIGGQSAPAAYLAGNPAVVSAALPEAPAIVCDVTNQLVLVGEVHLPDEGPVTKHPHFSEPWLVPQCESRTAADASNRLLEPAQARWPRLKPEAQSTLGLQSQGSFSKLL